MLTTFSHSTNTARVLHMLHASSMTHLFPRIALPNVCFMEVKHLSMLVAAESQCWVDTGELDPPVELMHFSVQVPSGLFPPPRYIFDLTSSYRTHFSDCPCLPAVSDYSKQTLPIKCFNARFLLSGIFFSYIT